MADDKTEKPPETSRPSKPSRRPTTIDLKATEFKAAPTAQQAPPSGEPQAEPSAAPPPDAQVGEQPAKPASDVPARKPLPWALIAAGVGGAALFLAIGVGVGHWLSRDMAQTKDLAKAPQSSVHAATPIAPPQPAMSPELLDRLAKLEAALAASRVPDPQLIARIAAAEAQAKAIADMAAARERRNDEVAVIAREAKEKASSAASVADEASQKARASSPEQSRAELEAMVARLAAIEAVSRANQAEIAKRGNVDDARSRTAIAALSLRNAVDSGLPFSAELAALRSLSGDAKSIAALEPFAASGVPTAASLSRELQATMPAIWKAARTNEPVEGSFLDRLSANAGKIVRVRPAGEAQGDDAPSVKARLETRADQSDIRGALAELGKLPPDARAPALGWIKKAEARNAALAAAQTLAQSALSALAKPGS